jgi:hypothetical protein
VTTVRFVDVPDTEWTRIAFPYDADLVELVKQCSVRTYDKATKTWSVLDEMAVRLADVMTEAGHVVLYGDEPPPAPRPVIEPGFFAPTDGYDADAVAAGLISALPGQRVGAVFRAMAKQLYPDLYRRR